MPAGVVGSSWATNSWLDTVWEEFSWADLGTGLDLEFVLDLNTRIRVYLCDLYSAPANADLTTLVLRYLRSQTGEMNARLRKLVTDATDAMT